ncbi:MAG: phospholipid carrier-dependent glycosyltransferase [Propionibacteriales bacterium]|nr:phospholipid carrier-dependent glycosyltransferase [Propionibacteriales bacterium]
MWRVTTTVEPAASDRRVGLGRTVDGGPLPRAAGRLTPLRGGDGRTRLWGWIAPLVVTAIGGVLRFWNLGRPHDVLFDETYYAKDAWSLLEYGYVRETVQKADARMLRGEADGLFTSDPSFYVHPDLGKWMIAVGEWLFGLDPFGWRFSSALVGTLTILVLARLVLRLTGSVMLGSLAGLLLAVDGLHFVMSRMALLDVLMTFFVVCAVACLVADRDWGRRRLARVLESGAAGARAGPVRALMFRPWRLAAGACFGLAVGTKWSAVFALAGFGLLVWAWDSSARKAIGVRRPVLKAAVADGVPAFFSLFVTALIVYVATWSTWFVHAGEYESAYAADWGPYAQTDASGLAEAEQSLRSLWNYHEKIWDFHTGQGIRDATHPYSSHPAGWPIINRPVGIAVESEIPAGEQGCPDTARDCIRQILAIGTPSLWWGGALALLVSVGLWIGGRDWRYGLALVGVLSSWLPWLRYADRPLFYFYAVAMIPFTIVAITLVIGRLLGPPAGPGVPEPSRRRMWAVVTAGVFVILVVANFVFYYPIYTNGLLTHEGWLDRIWFTRWI